MKVDGGQSQNWAIVQGPDGLIYVGNSEGVLEYDGVSWRRIPVSNQSTVRSLAIGAEGRVFVGAVGELGYVAPDSQGRMRFVSLVDHITPEDRDFSYVWRIVRTSNGVYFRTNERLFRWNGREMKVWRAETHISQIFAPGDVLYVQQRGIGLMRLDDDSLEMAPGGVLFQDERIRAMVSQGETAYLVITRNQGMFRCAMQLGDAACTPFSPGLTDLLVELQPYHVTGVSEGILAITTLRGGVILLDRNGRLLRILNQASGLRDDDVKFSYLDRQGGLWLGLNNGLARVETGVPLSYWDKTLGLPGNAQDIARHQGRLYAATSLGVYSLAPAVDGAAPRFLPYPGTPTQCWSLLSTPQGLLAGCSGGLYNLDDQQLIWSAVGENVFSVCRSRRNPTQLYLGLAKGLGRMRLRAGRWTDFERIDSVRESLLRTMVEDAQGRLWIGTIHDGVLRLESAAPSEELVARDPVARDPVITRFSVPDGVPDGGTYPSILAGRVTVLSTWGRR